MPSDSKLTRESLAAVTLCYASCSLGKPTDPLPDRLSHLSSAGFSHIELSFPDLQAYASVLEKRDVGDKEWDVLVRAAEGVKALLDERRLRCFILQPFGQFEGWPEGTDERKDAWERVEGWIRIAKAVGTETLQVRRLVLLVHSRPLPSAEGELPGCLSACAGLTHRLVCRAPAGRVERRRDDRVGPRGRRQGPARAVRPPRQGRPQAQLRELVLCVEPPSLSYPTRS